MAIDRKYWDAAIKEVMTPAPQTEKTNNLAQYLLLHTASGKGLANLASVSSGPEVSANEAGAKSEHHGILGKIFDAISTPLYSTETFLHDTLGNFKEGLAEGDNPLEALGHTIREAPEAGIKNLAGNAIRGATDVMGATADITSLSHLPGLGDKINAAETKGWDKSNKLAPRKMGHDLIGDVFGVHNKWAKYGGGFGLDVLTDPLTYVPGVDIFSIGRKAKLAQQGFREGDHLAEEALTSRAAASTPNTGEALAKPPQVTVKPTPVADLATGPTIARQLVDPSLSFKATGETLYHGTPHNFEEFGVSPNGPVLSRQGGEGYSYFTHDPEIAAGYGPKSAYGKGRVIESSVYGKTLDLRPFGPKDSYDVTSHLSAAEQKVAWDKLPSSFKKWVMTSDSKVAEELRKIPEGKTTTNTRYNPDGSTTDTDFASSLSWAHHDGDNALIQWAKENGYGKIRVPDSNVAGNESIMALHDFIGPKALKKFADNKLTLSDFPEQIIPNRVLENFGQSVLKDPESVAALKVAKRSDDAKRAANVRWGKPADWHDIPDAMTQEERASFVDTMRAGKMAKKGVVADGKGNISMQAGTSVLRDIAEGKIRRFGPEISPVDHPELVSSVNRSISKVLEKAHADGTAGELKPASQVDLFQNLSKEAASSLGKGAAPQKIEHLAIRMLKTAEDTLIQKGVQPTFFNGMRVRLSDVLAEIKQRPNQKDISSLLHAFATGDTKVIKDPDLAEALNTALGRRSFNMADFLGKLTDKADEIKNSIPDEIINHPVAQKRLAEKAREAAHSAGATTSEGKAIQDYLIQHLGIDNTRAAEEISKLSPKLAASLGNKLAAAEVRATANKAVMNTVYVGEELAKDVTGKKVFDSVFTRASTWYGRQREMKQFADDAFGYAEFSATLRGIALNNLAKNYTKAERYNAFNLAQLGSLRDGKFVAMGSADARTMELAETFHKYLTDLLGATGMEKYMVENGTTAIRAQATMSDVNKMLKAQAGKNAFQFIDSPRHILKTGGAAGEKLVRDYSGPMGWLKSWEIADGVHKDPLRLIQDIDIAMSKTTAQYNLLDDFAARFGAREIDKHFKADLHTTSIAEISRLMDHKFHPEVAKQFGRVFHDLGQGAWVPTTKTTQFMTSATRKWKTSVTIYRPIHHIRNLIGDSFNMWLAGINDPLVFGKSMDILATQKSRYNEILRDGDFEQISKLISPEAMKQIETGSKSFRPGKIVTDVRGHKINAEQYWVMAERRGLIRDYNKVEDLYGQTPLGELTGNTPEKAGIMNMKPFGGRVHTAAAKLSEHREHYVRMAHFVGAVEKSLKKLGRQPTANEMSRIADEAASRVRRWHPDGTDLTHWEQKYARNVIPFYSWTRKEIPLLLQAMVERPAKIAAYPRLQYALQGAAGLPQNENGMLDPFPNNQMFPDWIRATGIGPIGDPQSGDPVARFFGSKGYATETENGREGQVIVNPSNPFNDVVSSIFGLDGGQQTLRSIVNQANPALAIPIQLAMNQTFSGAPITKDQGGKGIISYLMNQAPYTGDIGRLAGVDQKPGTSGKQQQAIIDFLLGIGLKGTGPYEKQAEFEAKERARNASK